MPEYLAGQAPIPCEKMINGYTPFAGRRISTSMPSMFSVVKTSAVAGAICDVKKKTIKAAFFKSCLLFFGKENVFHFKVIPLGEIDAFNCSVPDANRLML